MVAEKETKKRIIFNIPEYDLQHPGTIAPVGMLYVYRSFELFRINLSTFVGSLISFIGMVKRPHVSQCKFIHLKSVIDTAGLCKSPSLQCVLGTSLCINSLF